MIKRIFVLMVTSSLISAGLLFFGTMLMGKFSPALAFSQNDLVAGTNVAISPASISIEENVPLKIEQRYETEKNVASATVKHFPTSTIGSDQTAEKPVNIISAVKPVTSTSAVKPVNITSAAKPVASTSVGMQMTDLTIITKMLKSPNQFVHISDDDSDDCNDSDDHSDDKDGSDDQSDDSDDDCDDCEDELDDGEDD